MADEPKAIECGTLPNGCTLYVKDNAAGGRTYYSDEVGGGVVVWDTCLVDQATLLAAMTHEATLARAEAVKAYEGSVFRLPCPQCKGKQGCDCDVCFGTGTATLRKA
jgi:hypothetical protein